MALYLAMKEIWRNKGRFFLFSLVIALITILVLFIAALAQGLASANKEYLEKLNADLILFQKNTDYSTTASRVGRNLINNVRRVPGVVDVGPIGFSNATIVFADGQAPLDISLIGVEPGRPGMPPVLQGESLRTSRGYQAVLDKNAIAQRNIQIGDEITIKTIQGSQDEFTKIRVVGFTDGRQYFYAPSIFVPFETWDRIRPQPVAQRGQGELIANVLAVQLEQPAETDSMALLLQSRVTDIEAVDRVTAYEATPGYQAQQSTLNTQRAFTLLIGILVIGGFFQIQTLQKVPQIGVLKAIGTSSHSVAVSVVVQIIVVTILGVLLGTVGTVALTMALPTGIPIVLTGNTVLLAIASLLLIGPIGGMVSIRLALQVEPLRALGM